MSWIYMYGHTVKKRKTRKMGQCIPRLPQNPNTPLANQLGPDSTGLHDPRWLPGP